MWMSLIGDLIGSSYENKEEKNRNLPLLNQDSTITDETVLLVGTADSVINGTPFSQSYRKWANKYPDVSYGPGFMSWLNDPINNSNSIGNGAASRATIIGLAYKSEEEVIFSAKESALCSHNHPEGIAGAQASALAVFLANNKTPYEYVIDVMAEKFDYLLFYDLDQLNRDMGNDSTAINTVPVSIYLGFTCKSVKDCIRNCLYVGGDVDTIMSIACSIASARFPSEDVVEVSKELSKILSQDKEMIEIVGKFIEMYHSSPETFSIYTIKQ